MTDVTSKRIETWDSVLAMSIELAKRVESAAKIDPKLRFDSMLVIPRGGYYPANIVGRLLNFSSTDIIHASVASYRSGEQQSNDFRVGQLPNDKDISGKAILIVEEVCDTGMTLDYVKKYLVENGATSVHSAVLHYKPSKSLTGFVPDWYVVETDEWVVYPWEIYEEQGHASVVRR